MITPPQLISTAAQNTAVIHLLIPGRDLPKYMDPAIQEIMKTVARADKPDARFADHEDVASWLRTWGTDKELDPPK